MPEHLVLRLRDFLNGFGWQRAITHLLLAAFTAFGIWVSAQVYGLWSYILTFAFGYVCLIFVGVTLLIGPLNLLRKRYNPVSFNLRRDIGIWAGITGVLHVVFALIERNGGKLLDFFFRRNGRPLLTLTGWSNWIGAVAVVLLVLLLVTSNDLMLRRLKGKRWKKLQRFNYVIAVLITLHTFGYQMSGGREQIVVNLTAFGAALVLGIQLAGVSIYQRRKRAHEPQTHASILSD